MSKLDRRSFLGILPAVTLVALSRTSARAQVRGMQILAPSQGTTYTYYGPLECFVRYRPRHAQNAPRIARVRYVANGVERGSGFPGSNPERNFYFSWFMPVPPPQGVDYTMVAEAMNSAGEVIGRTAPVNFRVVQLPG